MPQTLVTKMAAGKYDITFIKDGVSDANNNGERFDLFTVQFNGKPIMQRVPHHFAVWAVAAMREFDPRDNHDAYRKVQSECPYD